MFGFFSKKSSDNKLISLTKKQAKENSIFINIMNDLALSPFGQEQGVKFSKDDEVFIMAYAYARRFAACALYLRGILKRDIVAYTQEIWYNYGLQTSGEVEFQEKASAYANEFLQTYNEKFTKEFVITLSSFVIPKINNNEKIGIGKFVDGDDWLIDFIETKMNNNLPFTQFILNINNYDDLGYELSIISGNISESFDENSNSAYEFVYEQLDAASYGNAVAKNFVLDSGVIYDDYKNGMNRFNTEEGEYLLESILKLKIPRDIIPLAQLYILDEIMETYGIGKYKTSYGRRQKTTNLNTICEEIELEELIAWIKDNNLTTLPQNIDELKNIISLNLSNLKLNKIPYQIGILNKLETLILDNNELDSIPDEICKLKNLRILSCKKNNIKNLPENIGNLSKLIEFNMSHNELNKYYMPFSMTKLNNIQKLDFRMQRFDWKIADSIKFREKFDNKDIETLAFAYWAEKHNPGENIFFFDNTIEGAFEHESLLGDVSYWSLDHSWLENGFIKE